MIGSSCQAGCFPISTARMAQGVTRGQGAHNAGSGRADALGGATAGSIRGGLLRGRSGHRAMGGHQHKAG